MVSVASLLVRASIGRGCPTTLPASGDAAAFLVDRAEREALQHANLLFGGRAIARYWRLTVQLLDPPTHIAPACACAGLILATRGVGGVRAGFV
jgi:hypothetical protein